MTSDTFIVFFWLSLVAFAVLTWVASRWLGVIGLIGTHCVIWLGYYALAAVAIEVGQYEYDGILSIIGLTIQAFVLNCLLLPIGLLALWRRRRHRLLAQAPMFPLR